MRCTLDAACWLWLGCCWSNDATNSHLSTGPFNSRVLRSCMLPQCSHPPHWPAINDTLRTVTSCLRPTPADNLPILAGIPADLRRKGATLSLACRSMETGHLLHSALTCPLCGNAQHFKWRHPFVPAKQQLISSSDDQWNAEMLESTTRFHIFIPTHPPGMALPRTACVQLNHLHTGVTRFRSCLHK